MHMLYWKTFGFSSFLDELSKLLTASVMVLLMVRAKPVHHSGSGTSPSIDQTMIVILE